MAGSQPRRLRLTDFVFHPGAIRKLREWYAAFEQSELDASRDEFTPEGVPAMDKRSKLLLDAAWDLASDEDWADDAAVAELLRLAGRHRDALRVAEINARHGGTFVDLYVENRAQRLLEAALTGHPVRQLGPDEEQRINTLDTFAELAPQEAWAELVRLIPPLDLIAAEIVKEASTDPASNDDQTASRPRRRASAWTGTQIEDLQKQVNLLVGPGSNSKDVIGSSVYARTCALNHLLLLRHSKRPV